MAPRRGCDQSATAGPNGPGSRARAHVEPRAPGAPTAGRERRLAPGPERCRRARGGDHAIGRVEQQLLVDVLDLPRAPFEEERRHAVRRHPEPEREQERVRAVVLGVLGIGAAGLQVDREPRARASARMRSGRPTGPGRACPTRRASRRAARPSSGARPSARARAADRAAAGTSPRTARCGAATSISGSRPGRGRELRQYSAKRSSSVGGARSRRSTGVVGLERLARADDHLDRAVLHRRRRRSPGCARTAGASPRELGPERALAPVEVVQAFLAEPEERRGVRDHARPPRSGPAAAAAGRPGRPGARCRSAGRACAAAVRSAACQHARSAMPTSRGNPDDIVRALADPERVAIAGALARGDAHGRRARGRARPRSAAGDGAARQAHSRRGRRRRRGPPHVPPGHRDAPRGRRDRRPAEGRGARARRGDRRRGADPQDVLPERTADRDPDEAIEATDRARACRARVRTRSPLRREGGEHDRRARSSPITPRCAATWSTRGSSTAITASTGARAAGSTSTDPARVAGCRNGSSRPSSPSPCSSDW